MYFVSVKQDSFVFFRFKSISFNFLNHAKSVCRAYFVYLCRHYRISMNRLLQFFFAVCFFFALHFEAKAFLCPDVSNSDTLLIADSLFMRELVVSVAAKPMTMRGDTVVYDVSAISLPEGSRLRKLLNKLPGVEVTAEGQIQAHGKPVTRIMLNGKDFFAGNKKIALDNLPVEVLDEVKIYDRLTERDEDMGFQSSEKEKVIDVVTVEGKDKGWLCDVSGGGGTEERYAGNMSLSQFTDTWQNMLSASADNLPSMFGVGDSYYDKLNKNSSKGDSDKQSYNVIVGRETDSWRVNGTAYYNTWDTENGSRSLTESYLQNEKSYGQTASTSKSKGHSLTTSLQLEWTNKKTTVNIEPSFRLHHSAYNSQYQSQTSDVDPYCYTHNPLRDKVGVPHQNLINRNDNRSSDESDNYTFSTLARVNHKLNGRGRVVNVEGRVEAGHSWGEMFSLSNLHFFRIQKTDYATRFYDSPSHTLQTSGKVTYIEPLCEGLKMLAEYELNYRYQRMNQSVYDLDKMFAEFQKEGVHPWKTPEVYRDSLSKFATNRYWNHRMRLMFQYVYGNLNMKIGVQANPLRTETQYDRYRISVDTSRTVMNWSPEFSLYYKHEDRWNLSMQYTGHSVQPDIFYLLPIPDDTDPLHVRMGNPGLRPSFTHTLTTNFFVFEPEMQRQMSLSASVQEVRNAMTHRVYYNSLVGWRRTTPVNINGNRSLNTAWTFGTSFKSCADWYIDFQGETGWSRRVGLQHLDMASDKTGGDVDLEYTTHQAYVQNYLGVQWTKGVFVLKPYGYVSYERVRSSLYGADKRDTWVFGYGFSGRVDADCGVSAAVDVYNNSRRGFIGTELNGNEFLCDAEVSYSFLKGRSATVRLQACDLFRNRATTIGVAGVSGRRETAYTCNVNSYAIFGFTYRFSVFGRSRASNPKN